MSHRRYGALAVVPLLLWIACGRNLDLPQSGAPTVKAVYGLGREDGGTPDGGLPALAGEAVAIHGSGFGSDPRLVQVSVGTSAATVLDAAPDRLVIEVPALPGSGQADVAVSTGSGLGALTGGLRYDGVGAPPEVEARVLGTTVPMKQVAPVEIPSAFAPQFRQDPVLGSLAVAIGSGDSALVVMPFEGVALAAVPLGIVPVSVTARFAALAGFGTPTAGQGPIQLQILAVDRHGNVAVSGVNFNLTTAWSGTGAAASLAPGYPLVAPGIAPTASCENQQVLFTRNGNYAVVAWRDTDKVHKIAALNETTLDPKGTVAPQLKGSKLATGGQVVSWSPTGTFAAPQSAVVYANAAGSLASSVWSFDPSLASPTAPTPLLSTTDVNGIVAACSLVASATRTYTAVTVSPTQNRFAIAFTVAGDVPRLAEVDKSQTIVAATVYSCGFSGPAANALTYCSDPTAPIITVPPLPPNPANIPWILAATLANVQRFTHSIATSLVGPATVGDIHTDASLQLGTDPLLSVPSFGGLAPVSSQTALGSTLWRLLAVTPDADLQTLLPVTMTNVGPVYRLAPYGSVSVMMAEVDTGAPAPVAVADHTLLRTGGSGLLDTAGAAFILPLLGGDPVSLGGGSYGRSAAWLARSGVGGLAYTADYPSGSTAGAAGMAIFSRDVCQGGYSMTASRGVTASAGSLPDLVVEGPARAGLFGPGGVTRYGPAAPPIYVVSGTRVDSIALDATTFPCLVAGDWSGCGRASLADLGTAPLDLVLSAGDATLAARHLDAATCPAACAGNAFCNRATCSVAKELLLAKPGAAATAAATAVALPEAPLSVAADRAGGFVISLACDNAGGAATGPCFSQGTLCAAAEFNVAFPGSAGALVLVPEDGSAPSCLAVRAGLDGTVALTPNGAQAWVASSTAGGSVAVTRMGIRRKTSDGTIDLSAPLPFISRLITGLAADVPPGFAATGMAFSPDGSIGVSTLPGEFRVVLFE